MCCTSSRLSRKLGKGSRRWPSLATSTGLMTLQGKLLSQTFGAVPRDSALEVSTCRYLGSAFLGWMKSKQAVGSSEKANKISGSRGAGSSGPAWVQQGDAQLPASSSSSLPLPLCTRRPCTAQH